MLTRLMDAVWHSGLGSGAPLGEGCVMSQQGDEVWRALGLAAPARRALLNHGIDTVEKLRKFPYSEIAALHGMGPHALTRLEPYLKK